VSVFSIINQDYINLRLAISINRSVDISSDLYGYLEFMLSNSNLYKEDKLIFFSPINKKELIEHWNYVREIGHLIFPATDLFCWASDEDFWEKNFISVSVQGFETSDIISVLVPASRIKDKKLFLEPLISYGKSQYTLKRLGPYRAGIYVYGVHKYDSALEDMPFSDTFFQFSRAWLGNVKFQDYEKPLFYYLDKRPNFEDYAKNINFFYEKSIKQVKNRKLKFAYQIFGRFLVVPNFIFKLIMTYRYNYGRFYKDNYGVSRVRLASIMILRVIMKFSIKPIKDVTKEILFVLDRDIQKKVSKL